MSYTLSYENSLSVCLSLSAAAARVGDSSTVAASSCLLLNALFAIYNLQIPPMHDVPLHLRDAVSNFTVEILKEPSAKMDVATDEPHSH
ncbi:hypothetical protein PVK06_030644 [Gossypium arboreum]|uniref:Uncharacterized protein n=1 Tax=Gossypium arboreum TaxID=29729 RepID=A0ABR0NNV1_GOSAR|nr:hypothetical protein PVK06_030644 [Gossypium arboreum]